MPYTNDTSTFIPGRGLQFTIQWFPSITMFVVQDTTDEFNEQSWIVRRLNYKWR